LFFGVLKLASAGLISFLNEQAARSILKKSRGGAKRRRKGLKG
jgi:hypothetical protein